MGRPEERRAPACGGWKFDAFITVDHNLPAQQRVGELPFGVIVMVAPRNDTATLRPLMGQVRAALEGLGSGQLVRIEY